MVNGISNSSYLYGNHESNTLENKNNNMTSGIIGSKEECQTCKNRKYQDGSSENVSYKSPTHLSPSAANSAVRAHENEHVANAYTKAAQNNGTVINASVKIKTAVCPECGETYVSGGVTNTLIKYSNKDNPYQQQKKSSAASALTGKNLDYEV